MKGTAAIDKDAGRQRQMKTHQMQVKKPLMQQDAEDNEDENDENGDESNQEEDDNNDIEFDESEDQDDEEQEDSEDEDEDEDDLEEDDDNDDDQEDYDGSDQDIEDNVDGENDQADLNDEPMEDLTEKKEKIVKPLTKKKLKRYEEDQEKRGVVYLSRIPPFMKPQKLRYLLGKFAAVDRIYLAPEDPKSRLQRKRLGGNKKKKFTEGWVEFLDKKEAKRVAAALNGQIIGGKKSGFYHDDLWMIKYLPKFKWHHLTERIAYEKAVREQKLKAELAQAKRENAIFMKNVEKSQALKKIEKKKKSKQQLGKNQNQAEKDLKDEKRKQEAAALEKIRQRFRQRKAVLNEEEKELPKNLASKLFSKQ